MLGRSSKYPAELRREAVELVRMSDRPRLEIARSLGIRDSTLANWVVGDREHLHLEVLRRPLESAVYTSLRFANHLEDYGLVASFGSTGDAYDNAAMEAFWATLKRELAWIHGRQHWSSRAALRGALFDYIEAFYNRARHQAGLGHRTPHEVYAAALVA